jgi:hypothetical protein
MPSKTNLCSLNSLKKTFRTAWLTPVITLVSPLLFTQTAIAGESKSRSSVSITLNRKPADGSVPHVKLAGLTHTQLRGIAKSRWTYQAWVKLFRVEVSSTTSKTPSSRLPMLGSYRIQKQLIIFEPRFPLRPGLKYRAIFNPQTLPGNTKAGKRHVVQFSLPKLAPLPAAKVSQIFPSGKVLPENVLKFYIHFSAPMSRGEAYTRIQLLDSKGRKIADPFLELGEELWDRSGTRFTLFIDPGRIKRGLKPREDVGPVFENGKSYTLTIDRKWADERGCPLTKTFRKSFKIGPPDSSQHDPKYWKLTTPTAGTKEPLTLQFPEPLDHALLHRMILVNAANGKEILGEISVDKQESRWRFTPKTAWKPGSHSFAIDSELEDRSGNSLGRPFEVDVVRPIQLKVKKTVVLLPFIVRER